MTKQNNLCNFGTGHCEEHFKLGPVVQEEMSFKDISYLQLLQTVEPFCTFGRGHYEEHFYEILLSIQSCQFVNL